MPAKSGVSGGIFAVLPGRLGIGVLSPRLDAQGNSVRGVAVCRDLVEDLGLHLMRASRRPGPTRLRTTVAATPSKRRRPPGECLRLRADAGRSLVLELHGSLDFVALEAVSREALGGGRSVDAGCRDRCHRGRPRGPGDPTHRDGHRPAPRAVDRPGRDPAARGPGLRGGRSRRRVRVEREWPAQGGAGRGRRGAARGGPDAAATVHRARPRPRVGRGRDPEPNVGPRCCDDRARARLPRAAPSHGGPVVGRRGATSRGDGAPDLEHGRDACPARRAGRQPPRDHRRTAPRSASRSAATSPGAWRRSRPARWSASSRSSVASGGRRMSMPIPRLRRTCSAARPSRPSKPAIRRRPARSSRCCCGSSRGSPVA